MTIRLKYAHNAVDGNGTLLRGDLYQVGMPDLLGGNSGHRIWEFGTTKNYSLGARFVTADGRVFRYAKAGGTLIPGQGCMTGTKQHVAQRALAAAVAATDTVITLTMPIGNTDGINSDGVIAKDELEGGYIVIFPTITNNAINRMILGNSAVTGGATAEVLSLTLDAPVGVALTISHHAECIASPYLGIQLAASEVTSIVGVACVVATVGTYLWIQTWGVCWLACQLDCGTSLMDRQLVFRHDGSCDRHDQADAKNEFAQHAGFMLNNGITAETATQGAPFIMLQISV